MRRPILWTGLGAALLVVGYLASRGFHTTSPPLASPPTPEAIASNDSVRFAQAVWSGEPRECRQGDKVPVEGTLLNDGPETVRLTYLHGTCGCMAMQVEGKPLALPLELSPSQQLKFQAEIDTHGRGGLQRFLINLRAETAAKLALPPQAMEVLLRVRVPFVALPTDHSLEFDCEQIANARNCTFILYDDWPGAGLTIQEITGTAHGRLSWRVEPLAGEETIGVTRLKKRLAIHVAYRPAAGVEEFSERLTITPSDPKAAPLVLKVWGKVLQPYSITPRELVFHSASPSRVRRVYCHFRKPDCQGVRILSLPSFLEGTVGAVEEGKCQLEFTCKYPAATGKHEGAVDLELTPGGRRINLPVAAYVEP